MTDRRTTESYAKRGRSELRHCPGLSNKDPSFPNLYLSSPQCIDSVIGFGHTAADMFTSATIIIID